MGARENHYVCVSNTEQTDWRTAKTKENEMKKEKKNYEKKTQHKKVIKLNGGENVHMKNSLFQNELMGFHWMASEARLFMIE